MTKMTKARKIVSLLLMVVFSFSVTPSGSVAQAQDSVESLQEEMRRKAREREKESRRIQKVYQLLEKGRKERGEHKYRAARRYGEKALKVDPGNPLAKAFLEQLEVEEREYEKYQEYLERKREEKKRAEKEARRRKKEEKALKKKKPEPKKEEIEEAAPVPRRVEPAKKAEEKEKPAEAPREEEKAPEKERPEPAESVKPGEAQKDKPAPEAPGARDEMPLPEGEISKHLKKGQPIIVDGDKVEYFEGEGRIVADGNVSITYGDVVLKCDNIEVNTRTRIALCEGNVSIKHPEGVLTGERIRYDFNKKEGEIIGGQLDAFPWFGQAEQTGKVAENEYLLRKGFVTTCDLDEPHYRIAADEIRVFPDDKVIAKNVVAYIGKVPVMWFPYYYHPIIQTRAKVQFIPGLNKDWGYFLLSAWRFYVKGKSKVDLLLDYRTKKGFAEGLDFYYNMSDFSLKGLGEGLFRAYFVHQNDFGTYEKSAFRDGETTEAELRKRFQWKHRIDFEPETVGVLEFNKLSDEYFLKDYYYNEYEQNNRIPPNYVSVISSKQNYTFSLLANKRFNDFFTVTQKLPEVKLDIPDQRLWKTPLYYRSVWSATAFEKDYAFLAQPTEKTERLDTYHKFSYVTKLGPVNVTPFGEFRGTLYSKRKNDSEGAARMIMSAGVDVFSRFHRVYDYHTDALGLDINGLRHIVVPKMTYFHRFDPTIDKNKLFQMDSIDAIDKDNVVNLGLESKLQTKRKINGQMKSVDLLRFLTSVDYRFRMKKKSLGLEDGGDFEDLKFDLELRPYSWFFIQNKLEITPHSESIKSASVEFSLNPFDSFDMAFGYRYEHMAPVPRNQLTYDMSYRFNPKWKVGLYQRYDLQDNSVEEQQLSVVRDLHCWEVELAYNIKGSNFVEDNFTFWLAFKIKAFPDLPIGLDRSFEKRPPGELLGR
ncbi:MAG: LPS assembly protein LptD [Candidatus Omnitrophica bacterium]|nr:LPS assembly protein LptD [Candidatus Omnitrophota bacterium]